MTQSRANWHLIVAVAAVLGAEVEPLKDQTLAQVISTHGPFFWVSLLCAVIVGSANSILSTKQSTPEPVSLQPSPVTVPSNEKPNQPPVIPPAAPAPGAA